MAVIQASFTSMCLHRGVGFNALIPCDPFFPPPVEHGPYKTLYLLHGYTGCNMDWFKSSEIGDISMFYDLAIIMPDGENHFYVNDMQKGDMYSDYIGRELVDFTRRTLPLSTKREDTYIGGISMGGFGALINGMRHHETFGHIVAISPALVQDEIAVSSDVPNDVGSTRGFFESVFGPLDKVPGSGMDPEALAARLKSEGVDFPSIYLACGRNDRLSIPAKRLHNKLTELGVGHIWETGPGSHENLFFYPHLHSGLSKSGLQRMPNFPNPFWID